MEAIITLKTRKRARHVVCNGNSMHPHRLVNTCLCRNSHPRDSPTCFHIYWRSSHWSTSLSWLTSRHYHCSNESAPTLFLPPPPTCPLLSRSHLGLHAYTHYRKPNLESGLEIPLAPYKKALSLPIPQSSNGRPNALPQPYHIIMTDITRFPSHS